MPGRFSTPLASILSDHPGALNGHVAPSASSTNFSLPYNSPSTSVPLAGTFPRSPTTSRHSGGGSSSSSRKQRHARVAKTLRDLNGTWTLVPSSSTGSAPREGEDSATLWISHSNYPSSIFVKETTGREERVTRQTQRYFPPQSRGVWSCWWDGKRRSRWVVGRELEDRGGSGVLTSGLVGSAEYLEIEGEGEDHRIVEVWSVEEGKLFRKIVKFNGVLEEKKLVYEVTG